MDSRSLTFHHWLLALGIMSTCLHATRSQVVRLSYSELKQLNGSCTRDDSCSSPREDDSLGSKTCECGPQCKKYHTCCIDSPNLDQGVYRRPSWHSWRNRLGCHRVYRAQNLFMITRCDPRWGGNRLIKIQCESKTESLRDPFVLIPATNRKSQLVYKNYFCALCNNDVQGLVLWSIKAEKIKRDKSEPKIEDVNAALQHLEFKEEWNTWGFPGKTEYDFETVDLNFVPPDDLNHLNHICIPDVISDCHPAWKDEQVRKKCRAYMAAIYATRNESSDQFVPAELYRNVHCAVCNFAPPESTQCRVLLSGFGGAAKVPMSFTLLLDVNPKDGELVGRVSRCSKGESYDPFFKKCRALVCALPGFRMSGGRCVKD